MRLAPWQGSIPSSPLRLQQDTGLYQDRSLLSDSQYASFIVQTHAVRYRDERPRSWHISWSGKPGVVVRPSLRCVFLPNPYEHEACLPAARSILCSEIVLTVRRSVARA